MLDKLILSFLNKYLGTTASLFGVSTGWVAFFYLVVGALFYTSMKEKRAEK